VFGIRAQELEPCGVCKAVVNTLDGLMVQLVTKEELLKELAAISARVCENVPKMATKEECMYSVSLYGPYIIDLLLSGAKAEPQTICGTVGICDPQGGPSYKLLFPIIREDSINYAFTEDPFHSDHTFNYKMFLGDPAFLNKDLYELSVNVNKIMGCDITVKITNKTNFVRTDDCKDKGCAFSISKPGRGVWYYLTITAKVHTIRLASFSFSATEKNATAYDHPFGEHRALTSSARIGLIICLAFSSVCFLCIGISRCLYRRKINNRNIQYQPEPIFIGISPEMVVSTEGSEFSYETPIITPHNLPLVFPSPYPNYIQLEQMPHHS